MPPQTAVLIRFGYRVYRPEADIEGEDLVICTPGGVLSGVQLKSRPLVDWRRYGGRELLMLFPSMPYSSVAVRAWFLVPHDPFYGWVKVRHSHTAKGASNGHIRRQAGISLLFSTRTRCDRQQRRWVDRHQPHAVRCVLNAEARRQIAAGF